MAFVTCSSAFADAAASYLISFNVDPSQPVEFSIQSCNSSGCPQTGYVTVTRGGSVVAQSATYTWGGQASGSVGVAPSGGVETGDVVTAYLDGTVVAQITYTGQPSITAYACGSQHITGTYGPYGPPGAGMNTNDGLGPTFEIDEFPDGATPSTPVKAVGGTYTATYVTPPKDIDVFGQYQTTGPGGDTLVVGSDAEAACGGPGFPPPVTSTGSGGQGTTTTHPGTSTGGDADFQVTKGTGPVTFEPGDHTCPGTCEVHYPAGTAVSVSTTPARNQKLTYKTVSAGGAVCVQSGNSCTIASLPSGVTTVEPVEISVILKRFLEKRCEYTSIPGPTGALRQTVGVARRSGLLSATGLAVAGVFSCTFVDSTSGSEPPSENACDTLFGATLGTDLFGPGDPVFAAATYANGMLDAYACNRDTYVAKSFKEITRPRYSPLVIKARKGMSSREAAAVSALMTTAIKAHAYGSALSDCVTRAAGARAARDKTWVKRQEACASSNSRALASVFTANKAIRARLVKALRSKHAHDGRVKRSKVIALLRHPRAATLKTIERATGSSRSVARSLLEAESQHLPSLPSHAFTAIDDKAVRTALTQAATAYDHLAAAARKAS